MATFDSHTNLGYSTVLTAPSPATSGTSLVLAAGGGALMPTAPFNATIWPAGSSAPTLANAEIVRVTVVSTDTLTIVRAQEGTVARTILAGDQFANTITVKALTDIESAVNAVPNFIASAGANSISSGTLNFSNSNGVTFGMNGAGVVTASVAAGGGGGVAISAGANSTSTGTVIFSNSNGITFGMDGAGVVTASYTVPTVTNSSWTVSDAATSGTVGRLAFTNLNGVTLSLSSGTGGLHTIVGSHNALTSQSNQAFSAQGGSSAFQTLNFVNGNGITFTNNAGSVGASYTVPTQTNQTLGLYASSNTTGQSSSSTVDARSITFVGMGVASVGMSGGSIVFSVPSGGGAGDGGNTIAAGTRTAGSNSIVLFSNLNGLTWGLDAVNGSIMTASYTVPTVTNSSMTVSDAATSGTLARLAFTNLNGVTLSLSTGAGGSHTIVGSHNALTSQSNQAFSASGGSSAFQTLNFVNGNGLTFTNNAGSVGASYTVPTITSWSVSDAATSGTVGRLAFTNLNGVTLSLSTGAGGSHTIVGSHNALTSQSNQAFTAGGGSSAFQTLAFADTNGISFTNTNGSVGVAAAKLSMYAVSNTTQSTSGTANITALSFGGAGIASVGITNGSVIISVPAGGGGGDGYNIVSLGTSTFGGGTGGATFSTLSGSIGLHAGSNITISQTSNSIIFYGPTGGGGPSITQLSTQNRQIGASTVSTQGNNSVWIAPFRLGNYVSASTMIGLMSFTGTATSNQTNTAGVTLEYAFYTAPESNQSSFSQLWSTTLSGQVWNSGTVSASWAFNGVTSSSAGTALLTQFHGLRLISNTINSTLSPGLYAYGFRFSSSTAGNSSIMRTCGPVMDNPLPTAGGYMGAATNASIGYVDGGTWSATSATLPATFNLTDVKQTLNVMPFVKIGAI